MTSFGFDVLITSLGFPQNAFLGIEVYFKKDKSNFQ